MMWYVKTVEKFHYTQTDLSTKMFIISSLQVFYARCKKIP